MFPKSGYIIAVVIVLVIFVSFSQSETKIDNAECKATIKALIAKQMDSFKWCLTTMNFTSKEERSDKMMCILKCSMTKEGFLEEDGTVDIAGSMKILNNFSTEVQSRIVDYLMTNCQQYAHEVIPDEENCKSYAPMIKCGHAMVNKVCKY